jgi:hypothetical protein
VRTCRGVASLAVDWEETSAPERIQSRWLRTAHGRVPKSPGGRCARRRAIGVSWTPAARALHLHCASFRQGPPTTRHTSVCSEISSAASTSIPR